jgi:Tfp pilus assembly protein PilN
MAKTRPQTPTSTAQPSLRDLDFLPAKQRAERARRRETPWRFAVVALFALVAGVTAVRQTSIRKQLHFDLEVARQKFQEVQERVVGLEQLEAELLLAQQRAELFTFLRHPWPRSQLLGTVIAPLPSTIALTKLKFTYEPLPKPVGAPPAAAPPQNPPDPQTLAAQLASNDPLVMREVLAEDLKRLREEYHNQRGIVTLGGATNNVPHLHAYIAELAASRLLATPQLESVHANESDPSQLKQFGARLTVIAGLGQPGGPHLPATDPSQLIERQANTEGTQEQRR